MGKEKEHKDRAETRNKGIAAIVWPRGESFTSLSDAVLLASTTHKILLIADQDVNVVTLSGDKARDVQESFKKDPKLSLIYGDEPNFVFVDSESLSINLPVLRLNPPRDFRDLVKFFRDSLFCKDLYTTKRLPVGFGKLIGSESFMRAINRQGFEEERQKEEQLHRIVERLDKEDPAKAMRILEELGKEALKELRTSDTGWQLNWVLTRLEKNGYKRSDLLSN